MAEEVKSPTPPMTFKSSFWGFNRDEVLNCIDALAAKAREEEQQHRDQQNAVNVVGEKIAVAVIRHKRPLAFKIQREMGWPSR